MKRFVLTMVITLWICNLLAQTDHSRLKLKIGISYNQFEMNYSAFSFDYNSYNLQVVRRFSKFLDLGLFYHLHQRKSNLNQKSFNHGFGVRGNFQILPFFIKAEKFRISAYTIGGSGLLKIYNNPAIHLYVIYGGGIVFYPFEQIGLFSEYSSEMYFYKSLSSKRYHQSWTGFKFGLLLKI